MYTIPSFSASTSSGISSCTSLSFCTSCCRLLLKAASSNPNLAPRTCTSPSSLRTIRVSRTNASLRVKISHRFRIKMLCYRRNNAFIEAIAVVQREPAGLGKHLIVVFGGWRSDNTRRKLGAIDRDCQEAFFSRNAWRFRRGNSSLTKHIECLRLLDIKRSSLRTGWAILKL